MVKINDFDLLSFEPINFHGLLIYKPTLADISKMGKENFDGITNLLCIQEKNLKKQFLNLFPENFIDGQDAELYNPYNFFIRQSKNNELGGDLIFLKLQLAFFTYIQRQIQISNGNIVALARTKEEQDFVFSQETFEDFQHIIRLINCLDIQEEEEPEIQTDNLTMKQKFEEKRKLLKQAKAKEKEKNAENGIEKGLTLEQVISYVCAFPSSYNMTNVWNLTIYQLFDQFQKLQAKENYDHKIILLSSGMMDAKKLDVKYWIKTEKN